ncbi:hypothetical protein [Roseibium alexandrii]|uniref:hypothetical protein n=1 Tax=Roseibium alexandrii TaxID=388408 RepID=UPI0002E17DEC|nr:hypothetical protein [Roseibium alexandrii]
MRRTGHRSGYASTAQLKAAFQITALSAPATGDDDLAVVLRPKIRLASHRANKPALRQKGFGDQVLAEGRSELSGRAGTEAESHGPMSAHF